MFPHSMLLIPSTYGTPQHTNTPLLIPIDVEELHQWHVAKCTAHPSFERLPDEDVLRGQPTIDQLLPSPLATSLPMTLIISVYQFSNTYGSFCIPIQPQTILQSTPCVKKPKKAKK